jgi:hypothetical protein
MKIKNMSVSQMVNVGLNLVLVGFLLSIVGCAQPSAKQDSMKIEPAAASDVMSLESRKQRLSYALGMVLGSQFRDQSIEVDLDLYLQGLKDALSGDKTLLTQNEARSAVNMLQNELKRTPTAPQGVATSPTGIEVSFKLDPRLTRGMYMGERWVSPPTFTSIQEGKEATIEARVRGTNSSGKSINISPEWIPEDPGMVAVTSSQGDKVKITVRREGQTRLKVVASEVATEFLIKATYGVDTIRVDISPVPERKGMLQMK